MRGPLRPAADVHRRASESRCRRLTTGRPGGQGAQWPLPKAMVVRQDGVCVVWWEELQLGPNSVSTEMETPCCVSIHQGQALRAVCASLMRMAAASRSSGWWLCFILCRRCAACLA